MGGGGGMLYLPIREEDGSSRKQKRMLSLNCSRKLEKLNEYLDRLKLGSIIKFDGAEIRRIPSFLFI